MSTKEVVMTENGMNQMILNVLGRKDYLVKISERNP